MSFLRAVRKSVVYFVAIALPAASAHSRPASTASQVISITLGDGRAWVDNAVLVSGANLYPGERVRLDANTTGMLNVPGGLALVSAGSSFRVRAGGLLLERGTLQLRQETPSPFTIDGNSFRARFSTDSSSSARAEFMASESGARITSLAGVVEVTASGDATTYRVHPGESALLGDQVPRAAAANSSAGAVTRLVSPVAVERGSQQLNAALQSPVYWNDLLQSGRSGRARVSLVDGSVLSLGSDSSLRVLQHDASAQQTVLELAAGRMRGQVVKLTRPGAKFEIRTPSAVVGIVGTDFYLYVTPDDTELIVFEGVVRLTNPVTGQVVEVSAGMKAIMRRTGQIEGPQQSTPQEVAQAHSSTDVRDTLERFFTDNWKAIVVVTLMGGPVLGLSLDGPPTESPLSPFTLEITHK